VWPVEQVYATAGQALGLRRATDVIGGFQAWKEAGLPITSPPSAGAR
jgi:rhodanese-related sulfurtransferase